MSHFVPTFKSIFIYLIFLGVGLDEQHNSLSLSHYGSRISMDKRISLELAIIKLNYQVENRSTVPGSSMTRNINFSQYINTTFLSITEIHVTNHKSDICIIIYKE